MKTDKDAMALQISQRDNEINKQLNKLKQMAEIALQREEMEQQLQDEQRGRKELTGDIQAMKADAGALRQEDQMFTTSLRDELEHMQAERNEFQANCVEKDVKIKSLMQTNLDLQAQISGLDTIVASKENLEQVIVGKMNYINEIQDQKQA